MYNALSSEMPATSYNLLTFGTPNVLDLRNWCHYKERKLRDSFNLEQKSERCHILVKFVAMVFFFLKNVFLPN